MFGCRCSYFKASVVEPTPNFVQSSHFGENKRKNRKNSTITRENHKKNKICMALGQNWSRWERGIHGSRPKLHAGRPDVRAQA